ncbi:hypothetical protein B9Z55_021190 [Caenorhabditis nigoni]|uniref:DUF19 domain-containing protein n=1 Tax=Caenorhabditis nigoni TaxID=1611254 RepID=A0A2G5TQU0_9PELO|nr:hypothetical protein B9Z55_021190 [Caenorhabditis nigoni]
MISAFESTFVLLVIVKASGANSQALPPLFDYYKGCSNHKNAIDFTDCVEERLNLACNDDRACLIRNMGFIDVHTYTGRLFHCAKYEMKCSPDDFNKLQNTLKESTKNRCQKADCTGDVDKWFDQMFPNCVRNEGFNCEPPTTTTTPIITTTIAKIAISERDREESPSSSSSLQMNSMSNTSYSVHFIFVFLVVVF